MVSEEYEVYADHDGCHCEYVKYGDLLPSHEVLLPLSWSLGRKASRLSSTHVQCASQSPASWTWRLRSAEPCTSYRMCIPDSILSDPVVVERTGATIAENGVAPAMPQPTGHGSYVGMNPDS